MYRVFGSECAHCGADIIAPERSEHVCDRCIRNVWSCDSCGRRFEDLVYLPVSQLTLAPSAHSTSTKLAKVSPICRPFSLPRDMPRDMGPHFGPHFAGRKSLL